MLKFLCSIVILLIQPSHALAEEIYLTEEEYLHAEKIKHYRVDEEEFKSIVFLSGHRYLNNKLYDRSKFEEDAFQLSIGLYDNRGHIEIVDLLDETKSLIFENSVLSEALEKSILDVEYHIRSNDFEILENKKILYRYNKVSSGNSVDDVIDIMGERPECHKDESTDGYFCEWFRSYRLFFGPYAPKYMDVYQIKFNADEIVIGKLNYGFI